MWIIIIDMWVKEELTKFVFSANFCKYSDNNTFFQANFVSSSSAYIKLHGLLYSRLFKQSWDTYYCFPDRFANHPPSQNLTLFILIFTIIVRSTKLSFSLSVHGKFLIRNNFWKNISFETILFICRFKLL